jgi:hypothetical protein
MHSSYNCRVRRSVNGTTRSVAACSLCTRCRCLCLPARSVCQSPVRVRRVSITIVSRASRTAGAGVGARHNVVDSSTPTVSSARAQHAEADACTTLHPWRLVPHSMCGHVLIASLCMTCLPDLQATPTPLRRSMRRRMRTSRSDVIDRQHERQTAGVASKVADALCAALCSTDTRHRTRTATTTRRRRMSVARHPYRRRLVRDRPM